MLQNRWEILEQKLCAKGGGGGGGAGRVDFPDYMKTQHETWLDAMAAHILTATTGDNPFTTAVSYDPDSDIAAVGVALAAFDTVVKALDPENDFSSAYTAAEAAMTDIDEVILDVDSQVDSHGDILDADINSKVLPQFKRGMQDVNANMSSAFVIGESLIWSDRNKAVSDYQAKVEIKNSELIFTKHKILSEYIKVINNSSSIKVDFFKTLAHYTIEHYRIKMIVKKEENILNLEYDVKDAKWDMMMYQEGGALLASISGATVSSRQDEPNQTSSAIGGALSGAAAGFGVGGWIGAGVGALLGAAGSLL